MLRRFAGGAKALVKQPRFAGALRALRSSAIWSGAKLNEVGYQISAGCARCSADKATIGHESFECRSLYQGTPDEDLLQGPDMKHVHWYSRDQGQGAPGASDWGICPPCAVTP